MKTIPFTSEVPKVPGAYWWKQTEHQGPRLVEVYEHLLFGLTVDFRNVACRIKDMEGFWSPLLIPTSTLKTAVKEAFDDGYGIGVADGASNKFIREQRWAESNACKIVEEEE